MNKERTQRTLAWVNLLVSVLVFVYAIILFHMRGRWYYANWSWRILPFVLLGLIPLVVGLTLLIRHRMRRELVFGSVGIVLGVAVLVWIEQTRSRMRLESDRIACESQMLQLESAKMQWAFRSGSVDGTQPVTNEVLKFLCGHVMPPCPCGKTNTYTLGCLGEYPSCVVHGVTYKTHIAQRKK